MYEKLHTCTCTLCNNVKVDYTLEEWAYQRSRSFDHPTANHWWPYKHPLACCWNHRTVRNKGTTSITNRMLWTGHPPLKSAKPWELLTTARGVPLHIVVNNGFLESDKLEWITHSICYHSCQSAATCTCTLLYAHNVKVYKQYPWHVHDTACATNSISASEVIKAML